MRAEELVGTKLPEKDATITLEADAFYETGVYLLEKMENVLDSNEGVENKMIFVPAIVNLAFACELYLKSMIKETDRKNGRHYLKVLFEMQEDVIQKLIRYEVMENVEEINSEEDFSDCLDNISNTFFEWRYFYEPGMIKGTLNVKFLKLFAYMLKNIEVLYK